MANSKKMLLLFGLMLFSRSFADEPKFLQRLEWRSNANALEYKVEIQNTVTEEISSFTTEKLFAELSLAPGDYRYQVTAYDFLGRKAGVSAWTTFSVIQAAQPEIRNIEKSVTMQDGSERLEIAVEIANVSANTVVELVSATTAMRGELEIEKGGREDETKQVSKVYFQNVSQGEWRLRVTNASGFSTESEVIEVIDSNKTVGDFATAVAKSADEEKTPEVVAEKSTQEIEETSENVSEETIEKNTGEALAKAEIERAAKEAEERAAREAAEKAEKEAAERKATEIATKKAAEQKVLATQSSGMDITFAGGIGMMLMQHGLNDDIVGSESALAFLGRFSAFPVKRGAQRFGFELFGRYADFDVEEEYSAVDSMFLQFGANFVWKHTLFGPKSFVALKGGGGVVFVDYEAAPIKGAEERDASEHKLLAYPALTLGASVIFNPVQFLSLEAGVDFSLMFVSGKPNDCIMPYIPYACIGLRL